MKDYPFRTSRLPVVVDGLTFLSWSTGISRYALRTADGRGEVRRNFNRNTYTATLDGVALGSRFLGERAACKAIARELVGARA